MATKPETKYTYEDLQGFPEDNLRRELIGGELIVTAAPSTRHQAVSMRLSMRLGTYAEARADQLFAAPTDVFLSDTDIVEPDLIYVTEPKRDQVEDPFIRSAPDIVVEISSPSTRRLEIVRKKELYERFGVPEYWYVDLEADRIEVHRGVEQRYGKPLLLERGDTLNTPLLPGFEIDVDYVLGEPPEES